MSQSFIAEKRGGSEKSGRNVFFGIAPWAMDSKLPATGTAQFLKLLSPYIPDTFINEMVPRHHGRGRRSQLSWAQLYRANLLSVLTPAHAFNHLVRLLPEQRDWRRFALLPNRQAVPDVWMLNQFREHCGISGLRQINEQLLGPMLPQSTVENPALALIDATDLEAACSGHKKRGPDNTLPSMLRWAVEPSNADRVGSLSGIRNTPFGCGCEVTNEGSCWCHWSAGSHQPTMARAGFSSPA